MVYMEKMAEPPHSRRCRQLPSRGALRKMAYIKKPLLEERCHEVTEWWLEVINRYLCGELTILLFYIIIN